MKTIVLETGFFGKRPAIRIGFPFHIEWKELVKTYPGCQWDPKEKVWGVPYTDDQLTDLFRFFKGKTWLDYSRHQTAKHSPYYPELPLLKGKKDHITPLFGKLLELLRKYYVAFKLCIWLFEGQNKGEQYSAKSLQSVLKQALRKTRVQNRSQFGKQKRLKVYTGTIGTQQ